MGRGLEWMMVLLFLGMRCIVHEAAVHAAADANGRDDVFLVSVAVVAVWMVLAAAIMLPCRRSAVAFWMIGGGRWGWHACTR